MRKQFTIYFRDNKVITLALLFSIVIIASYIFNVCTVRRQTWFGILSQFAIGYIINFMFYITQVYIPQIRRKKTINECIYNRTKDICNHMNKIFLELRNRYSESEQEDEQCDQGNYLEIAKKIHFDDNTGIINVDRIDQDNQRFTIREWIILQMQFVEKGIDSLFKYYAMDITPDLMNTLEEILNSPMHQNLGRLLLRIKNISMSSKEDEDIFFTRYYKLMKALEAAAEYYKM